MRGVYSGHWINFELGVSGWFKIRFCIHIGFYIIINPFSRVKSDTITKPGEYLVVGFVLNTFKSAVIRSLAIVTDISDFDLR